MTLSPGDFAALATVALAATGGAWKVAGPVVKRRRAAKRQSLEAEKAMLEARPVLLAIAEQFKANGGATLLDRLVRIEDMVWRARVTSHAMAQLIDTACMWVDRRGYVTEANRAFAHMAGLDSADCLGNGWLAAVSARDRGRVLAEWRSAIEEGHDVSIAMELDAHPGRHARLIATAKRLPDGAIFGYVGRLDLAPWREEEGNKT